MMMMMSSSSSSPAMHGQKTTSTGSATAAGQAAKRKSAPSSSSGEESSSFHKRRHVATRSSSHPQVPPPALSPASVTITTSNGERIELVGERPAAEAAAGRSPYEDYGNYLDDSPSGGGSSATVPLLPCRVRRNYACKACDYTSINPRQFLYHQRDAHGQKGNIHECPYCMYASVHTHKLLRHISLVHRGMADDVDQLRTSGGSYLASPPPSQLPLPPLQCPVSVPGAAVVSPTLSGVAASSQYHRGLSGDGVPLPPDLEVILVEEPEDAPQTPNGAGGGSRKSVRPMLMEPSVVLLPIGSKNYQNGPTASRSPPSRSATKTASKRPPPPPPPLHRQNIRPVLQNPASFQASPLPPPPRLSSIRPGAAAATATANPRKEALDAANTTTIVTQRGKVIQEFSCSKCTFKSKSRVLVQRHEKVSHLKRKFFRCTKCNYVTNVRARYTKHVRYHDMPYIKCEQCDFSTPYKWNLDRHRRNHQEEQQQGTDAGGTGTGTVTPAEAYRCHRCSFSASSKQSLSVHLLNHHAENGGHRRRRRMEENGPQRQETSAAPPRRLSTPDDFGPDEDFSGYQNEDGLLELEEEGDVDDSELEMDDDEEDEDEIRAELQEARLEALRQEESGDIPTTEGDEEDLYLDEEDRLAEDDEDDELDGSSKPYACAACRESFASVSQLDRHVYECHEMERPAVRGVGPNASEGQRAPTPKRVVEGGSDSKPKFQCDLCPYQAKWISEVMRHRRVHVNDKPFACPHCYFRSKWKGDMTRHVSKYHSGAGTPPPSRDHQDERSATTLRNVGGSRLVGGVGAEDQDTEVEDIDQLLDQSMMVGGEEELHLFDERNNNNTGHTRLGTVDHQERPLDLSRHVAGYDCLPKEFLQRYNKDKDGTTGLLPYLLKMPPRRPLVQSRLVNAPIHLSPSVQLIPTSATSVGLGSSGATGMMQTIVTTAPISTTVVPTTTSMHTTTVSPSIRKAEQSACSETMTASDTGSKVGQVSPGSNQGEGGNRNGSGISPTVRKLYQCPYCKYSTTTASRFHMHVVVHLNQKPYMCSECGYRSNWQWDVTKHAKVKSARDPSHKSASVVLVNEVGAKNYEKYEKYAVYETISKSGRRSFGSEDPNASGGLQSPTTDHDDEPDRVLPISGTSPKRASLQTKPRAPKKITYKCKYCEFRNSARRTIIRHMSVHSSNKPFWCGVCGQSSNCRSVILRHCQVRHGVPGPIMQRDVGEDAKNPPLPSAPGVNGDLGFEVEEEQSLDDAIEDKQGTPSSSSSALVRCLMAPQPRLLSPQQNADGSSLQAPTNDETAQESKEDRTKRHKCSICPYRCRKLFDLRIHSYMHKPHEGAIFKCMFCPFYVSLKRSWLQHMKLHVDQPQEFARQYLENGADFEPGDKKDGDSIASTAELADESDSLAEDKQSLAENHSASTATATVPAPETASRLRPPRPKRYVCEQCPYKTGSHTTFLYHRQFHRPGRVGVHRCSQCSYSVTRPHLLGQHIRMHEAYDAEMRKNKDDVAAHASFAEVPEPEEDADTRQNAAKSSDTEASGSPSHPLTVATGSQPPPSPASPAPPGDDLPYELAGISRVWVSRNGIFLKMFKCRHCPHVSKKRAVIIAHERLHYKRKMTAGKQIFKCQLCNYTCKNAGILSSHQKVHREQQSVVMISDGMLPPRGAAAGVFGPALASGSRGVAVDPSLGSSPNLASSSNVALKDACALLSSPDRGQDLAADRWIKPSSARFPHKLYSSCGLCPAKFMKPHQVALHRTFHGANLAWQCQYCTYSARHRPHLHNHLRVHTDEYQKEFKLEQNGGYMPLPDSEVGFGSRPMSDEEAGGARLSSGATPAVLVAASSPSKVPSSLAPVSQGHNTVRATPGPHQPERKHRCHQCPAVFIKYSTLVYHLHLHDSNSKFKCPHCSYSVTNIGNLVRHVKVHDVPDDGASLQRVDPGDAHSISSSSPSSASGGGAKLQGAFACPKCPATFDKQLRYDVHVGLHGSKQRFQCDHCDYSVQYAANLVRHRRMHAAHAESLRQQREAAAKSELPDSQATTDAYTTTSITNSYALNGGTVIQETSLPSVSTAPASSLFQDTAAASSSSSKSLNDLLGETLTSMEGANISAVEKQQLLLQRLQSLQAQQNQKSKGASGKVTSDHHHQQQQQQSSSAAGHSEPKKLFRCGRCPYTHPRKDAVQSHMKRHAISDSTCPHCDYGSSLTSFLREHVKLHFKPLRVHQVDAFVQWEEFEVWAKYGERRRLLYRYSVDGREFTEDDMYEVANEEFLTKQKMRNGVGGDDATIVRQCDLDLTGDETAHGLLQAETPGAKRAEDSGKEDSDDALVIDEDGGDRTDDEEFRTRASSDSGDPRRLNDARVLVAGSPHNGRLSVTISSAGGRESVAELQKMTDGKRSERDSQDVSCCSSPASSESMDLGDQELQGDRASVSNNSIMEGSRWSKEKDEAKLRKTESDLPTAASETLMDTTDERADDGGLMDDKDDAKVVVVPASKKGNQEMGDVVHQVLEGLIDVVDQSGIRHAKELRTRETRQSPILEEVTAVAVEDKEEDDEVMDKVEDEVEDEDTCPDDHRIVLDKEDEEEDRETEKSSKDSSRPEVVPNGFDQGPDSRMVVAQSGSPRKCASEAIRTRNSGTVGDGVSGLLLKVPADVPLKVEAD